MTFSGQKNKDRIRVMINFTSCLISLEKQKNVFLYITEARGFNLTDDSGKYQGIEKSCLIAIIA